MLHISFGADINYAMQCGVAITSLCENNKDLELCFHILALCEDEQMGLFDPILDVIRQYNQNGEIIRIEAKHFQNMPEVNYISRAAYLRLLLPVVLKDDISQILYLDSDTVVLGSLKYFENNPLSNIEAAAAAIDLDGNSIQHHNRIDIPPYVPYYNSGVLYMNLDYWRQNDITRKALENIVNYQYGFQDQDAINTLLFNKIRRLPYKYNVQIGYYLREQAGYGLDKKYYEEIEEAKKHPAIVHYASYHKPWQTDTPYQELWLKYKSMTRWKDTPLMERPFNQEALNDFIAKVDKEASVWMDCTRNYYTFLFHLSHVSGGHYVISFVSELLRFFIACSKIRK